MSVVVFAKTLASVVPALGPALAPLGEIAWPWYVAIGTTVTLGAGLLASRTHDAVPPRAATA
jgi:hypothetical protein